MDADTFLRAATDPAAWLKKSISLRSCGDALWDRFIEGLKAYAESGDESAIDYLQAAQMFYGLSLEAAFKARILRQQPDQIEFSLSADGTGTIQYARMERFGTSIKDGHNLVALADLARRRAQTRRGGDLHPRRRFP